MECITQRDVTLAPNYSRDSTHLQLFGDRTALAARTELLPYVHCALYASGLCGHGAEWSVDPMDVRWPDPYDTRIRGLCKDCWRRRVDLVDQGRRVEEDPGEVDTSPFWKARHSPLPALTDESSTLALQSGQPGMRLLCYGDSITAGYCPLTAMVGRSPDRAGAPYAASMQETLTTTLGFEVEVFVCGAVGLTAKGLVDNADRARFFDCANRQVSGLKAMLAEHGPFHAVLLMVGVPDLAEGVQAAEIVERTMALHKMCFDAGVNTIALGIPVDHRAANLHSFATRRERVNHLLRQWASGEYEKRWTVFVDTAQLLPFEEYGTGATDRSASRWQPDGIHLTALGAADLGARLAETIAPWVASWHKESQHIMI